ncbi:hypothetical protein CROQUDRAFT_596802 [Cronartium quercuum f. sp. fusiforme G11]|uniref:Uncharacterized protein n=1 Tax=Cronartium quercuum f. sp. fusiforme G11 TaxID=708437 RepID=A0A9P6TAS6_9BASI|nr:hypothetical protein CROQUDRAFT_596802 [Cronartium quercuum f. sp. fusiforme G11]
MPPANLPHIPWVSHSDLLDHLTILNVFHHLRTLRPKPEFLHMALFRFELWIGQLELFPPIDSVTRLPPLDVLMTFTSIVHNYESDYILSHWLEASGSLYFEDSRRVYSILQIVDFPLSLAASQYRRLCPKSQTLGMEIPEQAMTEWFDKTNTIYDPILYFSTPSFRTTLCLRCKSCIESHASLE